MQVWKRSEERKLDQNRGTGEFIENTDWWFWNGNSFPGLLTIDQFSNARDQSLALAERSELSRLLIADSIVSSGRRPERSARFLVLLKKVSDYLESLTADDPNSTLFEFLDKPADVLKAYLNILQYWGYGYSWQTVKDVWNNEAVLIQRDGILLVVVSYDDVQYIQGRPFRFEVRFKGLSWHFNEGQNKIGVLQRHNTGSGSELRERWL